MIVILAGKTVKGNVTINVADKDDEVTAARSGSARSRSSHGVRGPTPVTP